MEAKLKDKDDQLLNLENKIKSFENKNVINNRI
jgi:hypothetical protein